MLVFDSSALSALARIGRMDLIFLFREDVAVTENVFREINECNLSESID